MVDMLEENATLQVSRTKVVGSNPTGGTNKAG